MSELSETVEMATLDKEMAEERAEALQLELDSCKERIEELQLDVDIIRAEMGEEGKGSAEAGTGVTNFELKTLQAQVKTNHKTVFITLTNQSTVFYSLFVIRMRS